RGGEPPRDPGLRRGRRARVPHGGAPRDLRGAVDRLARAPAVRGDARRLLGHPSRDLVVAKSLAYEMLRAPSAATSLADRERERRLRELDADALVVDILVRVKGWPESQALEATYGWLLAMHRAAAASGRPPRPG